MRAEITCSAILLACIAHPQVQLERQLASCGGTLASAGSIQLEYTAGDLTVSTATSATFITTQGFQQTHDLSTVIAGENPDVKPILFPNPTRDVVTVQWLAMEGRTVHVKLMDTMGRMVQTSALAFNAPVTFDLSGLANGTYFLRLTVQDGPSLTLPAQVAH